MTDSNKPEIRDGFALSTQYQPPTDPDLSAAVDDNILKVESIVAAMLSDKYNLSAEELEAFEELLDTPDVDPEKRHVLLQTLWNIAVCLIDYQWDNGSLLPSQNTCGSISYDCNDAASGSSDVLESSDYNPTQDDNEVAAEAPGQKGSP